MPAYRRQGRQIPGHEALYYNKYLTLTKESIIEKTYFYTLFPDPMLLR